MNGKGLMASRKSVCCLVKFEQDRWLTRGEVFHLIAVAPKYLAALFVWHWRQAGTSCDKLQGLRGWKSRNMVDRYAKFATDNLAFAASRIEAGRDSKVIPLSRFSHAKETNQSFRPTNFLN